MDSTFVKTIIRLLQLLWTLLVTALIGNVIATNVDASGSASAAVNFCMFVAVICWLAVLAGLVTGLVSNVGSRPGAPLVVLILDTAAVALTFIGAIVLSAKLKVVNCAAEAPFDPVKWGPDYIVFGSVDDRKRCHELQGSAVFLWFDFIAFVVGLAYGWWLNRRRGGGASSVAPSMSQFRV